MKKVDILKSQLGTFFLNPPLSSLYTHKTPLQAKWKVGCGGMCYPHFKIWKIRIPYIYVKNSKWWITLVAAVDVAHVWTTLFRTYFDSEALEKHWSFYRLYFWNFEFYYKFWNGTFGHRWCCLRFLLVCLFRFRRFWEEFRSVRVTLDQQRLFLDFCRLCRYQPLHYSSIFEEKHLRSFIFFHRSAFVFERSCKQNYGLLCLYKARCREFDKIHSSFLLILWIRR